MMDVNGSLEVIQQYLHKFNSRPGVGNPHPWGPHVLQVYDQSFSNCGMGAPSRGTWENLDF